MLNNPKKYDVFLSYNSQEKEAVLRIAERLKKEGINPFLDKWHLIPGDPWMEALEKALDDSQTCAVFIGPNGISPWENEEMRAAINQRVTDPEQAFRVIPVLLPGADRGIRGRLPIFLKRTTWVEFRESIDDEEALKLLIAGIRGIAPIDLEDAATYHGVNPYRGLRIFDEEHAPFFFGRKAITGWLVDFLRTSQFLAVIGPSGSGKSSLVRAGLIPQLKNGAIDGSEDWTYCVLNPHIHPLDSLAKALRKLYSPSQNPPVLSELSKGFLNNARTLFLEGTAIAEEAKSERLVITIDQFEEIFTLCKDDAERERFIENLIYASSIENSRVTIILTMRADFYGKCAQYPDLADRITDTQMLVNPLTNDELRESIELPAVLCGLDIEKGLTEAIVRDADEEPGALPLLQHALFELYNRSSDGKLTIEGYRAIGGLKGSIAKRAEAIYESLDAEKQKVMQQVMLNLITPGEGTEDTRRRATLADLKIPDATPAITEDVISTLADNDARLITTTGESGSEERIIEVAHEALIRSWGRLQDWIESDREFLTWRTKLRTTIDEWIRKERDSGLLLRGKSLVEAEEWFEERQTVLNEEEVQFIKASLQDRVRRKRRERSVSISLAVLSILAILSAVFAFRESRESQENFYTSNYNSAKLIEQSATQFWEQGNSVNSWLSTLAALNIELAEDSVIPQLHGYLLSPFHSRAAFSLKWSKTAQSIYLQDIVVSSQGTYLAGISDIPSRSNASETAIRIWTLDNGKQHLSLIPINHVTQRVAFSQDETLIASGSSTGNIQIWRTDTGELVTIFDAHDTAITDLAFSYDNEFIVSASRDNSLRIWNTRTAREAGALIGHTRQVRRVAINSSRTQVVSSSLDGSIRIWAISDLDNIQHKSIAIQNVSDVTFSPDGAKIIAALNNRSREKLIVLDALSGQRIGSINNDFGDRISQVKYSPNGKYIALAAFNFGFNLDGQTRIQFYDAEDLTLAHEIDTEEVVRGFGFTNDDKEIVYHNNGDVHIIDTQSEQVKARLNNDIESFSNVVMHPSRDVVATLSSSYGIRLWSKETGNLLSVLKQESSVLISIPLPRSLSIGTVVPDKPPPLVFSPDGSFIAIGTSEGIIQIWDLNSGELHTAFNNAHSGFINNLVFSPEKKQLITSASESDPSFSETDPSFSETDPSFKVWDLESNTLIRTVELPFSPYAITLSPDGTTIAISNEHGGIYFYDLETGKKTGELLKQQIVTHLDFSSDGKEIIIGDIEGTIELRNLEDQRMLHQFQVDEPIIYLSFSPDNEYIYSVDQNNAYSLWHVDSGLRQYNRYLAQEGGGQVASVHPNGTSVLTTNHSSMYLWDVQVNDQIQYLIGQTDDLNDLTFSQDGKCLITAQDSHLEVFDTMTGTSIAVIGQEWIRGAFDIAVSGSCENLNIVFTSENQLYTWSRSQKRVTPIVNNSVVRKFVAPDNRHMLTVSLDNTMQLYDLKSGNLISTFPNSSSNINKLSAFDDPELIHWHPNVVSIQKSDTLLEIRNLKDGRLVAEIPWSLKYFKQHAFDPEGKKLLLYHVPESPGQRTDRQAWEAQLSRESGTIGTFSGPPLGKRSIPVREPDINTYTSPTLELWDLETSEKMATVQLSHYDLNQLFFTKNGERFVYSSVSYLSGDLYQPSDLPSTFHIDIWDAMDGERIRSIQKELDLPYYNSPFQAIDSSYIAYQSEPGVLEIVELQYGETIKTLSAHDNLITAYRPHPDGQHLITSSIDTSTSAWRIPSFELVDSLFAPDQRVSEISFLQDSRWLIDTTDEDSLRIIDFYSRSEIAQLENPCDETSTGFLSGLESSYVIDPEGSQFLAKCSGGTLYSWNIPQQQLVYSLETGSSQGHELDHFISDDWTKLFTVNADSIHIRELSTGQKIYAFSKHPYTNTSRLNWAISPDGSHLIIEESENNLGIWNTADYQKTGALYGHQQPIHSITFNHTGTHFLAESEDGMSFWEAATGALIWSLSDLDIDYAPYAINTDENQLITSNGLQLIGASIATDSAQLAPLPSAIPQTTLVHEAGISSIALSEDNSTLITAGYNGNLGIWDMTGKHLRYMLEAHNSEITTLAINSTGTMYSSATEEGGFKVWDIKKQTPVFSMQLSNNVIQDMAFDPNNSNFIITISIEGEVSLWDYVKGTKVAHFNIPGSAYYGSSALNAQHNLYAIETSEKTIALFRLNDFLEYRKDGELTDDFKNSTKDPNASCATTRTA